jgi:hypothetical protein
MNTTLVQMMILKKKNSDRTSHCFLLFYGDTFFFIVSATVRAIVTHAYPPAFPQWR